MLRFDGETSFLRSIEYVTPVGHWQGKVESVSGPCRNVRVTELCEVKGDVTIPEQKRQQYGAHPASVEFAEDATENFLEL